MKNKYLYIATFIVVLWLITLIFSSFFTTTSANIGVIPVNGVIYTDGSFSNDATSSEQIIEWIDSVEKNPNVKGIIFEINSPGGTALAGKEIAQRIKEINLTTVAVIRDVGASAGYLIASACDHIYADELSITGSIAAVSSYVEYAGLLDKYNISYNRIVSAKYKDMGSPFKKITEDESLLFQEQIDLAHDFFVSMVANNRDISVDYINSLEGRFFLGIKAKEYGLIDSYGNMKHAKNYIKINHNLSNIEIFEFESPKSFFDMISNNMKDYSFNFGKGFALGLVNNNYPRIS